jgi:hypothetical protein
LQLHFDTLLEHDADQAYHLLVCGIARVVHGGQEGHHVASAQVIVKVICFFVVTVEDCAFACAASCAQAT